MSFIGLNLKDCYQTDSDNIPQDFFNLIFPYAKTYKRAAGFFSSSCFKAIGVGIKEFYLHGGYIQLIVSPQFSEEDYKAICTGLKAKEDIALQRVIESFNIDKIADDEGCNILAWLIYENRLDIRVVVRKDNSLIGIFHDKFSIIEDDEGNKISFRGSMNEGVMAYVENFETIEVDNSWDSGVNRTRQRENQFEEIWFDSSKKWVTVNFPEAIKKQLISIRKPIPGIDHSKFKQSKEKTEAPFIPEKIELRKYQKIAIASWLKNSQRGIFEMATGTGKTITSIVAMVKLIELYHQKNLQCGIVIVVPYKVLLEQWLDVLKIFNIYPIACYDSKDTWRNKVSDVISLFNSGTRKTLALITTNKTLTDETFQEYLSSIKGDYIFCADEMHHLTSDSVFYCLPQNAKYRLGLSATLMTKYNSENMNRLLDYFGGIVYQFTMKEAIDKGFLTHYNYYPIFVDLTEDELSNYLDISKKISKMIVYSESEYSDDNPGLTALLAQRARLIASASKKIEKLYDMKDIIGNTSFNIFYCGDKIEADMKFIQKITDLLNNEIGIYTCKFTAEEDKSQRENILRFFGNGDIKALTAIRCLDEGIDIPQLRRAFILSSGTNPKEFIQRRGRILRKFPGKEIAEIYDFIVFPTLDKKEIENLSEDERKSEKKIIMREYERLKEFANLADNGIEAYERFLQTWELYS